MEMKKTTTKVRLKGWAEKVSKRIARGQSVRAFCEENGISPSTYYVRLKKVRTASCAETTENQQNELQKTNWTQLSGISPTIPDKSSLVVEIGECKIEVTQETDTELLAQTCRVLKSLW